MGRTRTSHSHQLFSVRNTSSGFARMETSYQDGADWSLSPNAESSPVSALSSCMRNLLSRDSLTPTRRLAMTPQIGCPPGHETPTVNGRNQSKMSSPASSSPEMWHRRGDADSSTGHKENALARKRVRVRLFSRSSPGEEHEAVSSSKRHHGCPDEGASYHGDLETPDPEAVMLFQRLRSRKKSAPTPIPDTANTDLHLIGDFTKQHVLPVERVDHQEVHCVSADTVAALIRGQFSAVVEDFVIIDCRYPYEYNGGHIKGAVNLYTESQISQAFLKGSAAFQASPGAPRAPHAPKGASVLGMLSPRGGERLGAAGGTRAASARRVQMKEGESSSSSLSSSPRKLIVFHCEFSSERGPRLCQYLRKLDRELNSMTYPFLLYPEIYLLHGGYKRFYTKYPELCEPRGYVHMRHRDFREHLRRLSRKRHPHHRRRPIRSQQRTARF